MLSRCYNNNNNIDNDNNNEKTIIDWITSNNYQQIAKYIFAGNIEETEKKVGAAIEEIHNKKYKKIKSFANQEIMKKQLLSRVLTFYKNSKSKSKGKQFYIMIDESKIAHFKHADIYSIKPYRILTQRCIKGTNDHGYLYLFASTLMRKQFQDITFVYNNEWLYYASFSPIWLQRIQQYNGIQDMKKKQIVFPNEEHEEEFYNCWNYETDEQSTALKQKTIPEINIICSWEIFQQTYNQNGIFNMNFN